MNTFAVELWDDEGMRCTFYTVRWDDAKVSETDKFFNKYDALPAYKLAAQQMLSFVLDSIGDDHGAVNVLFNRFENEVVGLPNTGKVQVGEITFLYPNFPLRLYALRINNREDIVVLFNGGIKSAGTNQQSRNLNLKWKEACLFARRIEEGLRNGEILLDTKKRLLKSAGPDEQMIL